MIRTCCLISRILFILTILGENTFSYFKKDVILSKSIVLVLSKTDSFQEKNSCNFSF